MESSSRYVCSVLFPALVAIIFSGCAIKRDAYDVPAVPIPEAFIQAPGPVESPRAPLADIALDTVLPTWWEVFGDEELNSLMDMALSRNQDLRIASFRVSHTQARFMQALGREWPTVSVPARASIEAPEDGVGDNPRDAKVTSKNIFEISLRGDWRLDVWGERRAMAEAAEYRLWKAAFDHDTVKMNLVADVAMAYAEYLSLSERVALALETERVVESMLKAVQGRLDQGDATRLDYEQQRAAVYGVKAVIPELELQREEALHRLSRLLGITPSDVQIMGDNLRNLTLPRLVPGIPSALLLRRPDVRSAEADLLAADADIDTARARILPPLDLSAQIGYGSRYLTDLFMPHALAYTAVASLAATIFDAGVRRSEVDFSRARHEELVELYVRVIYDAVRDVEDALAQLRRTDQRLDALDNACDASEQALAYSRKLYELRAVDYLNLLMTERTHHKNLDERLKIRLDRYKGMMRLFRALGGGVAVMEPLPGKGTRPEVIPADSSGTMTGDSPPAPSRHDEARIVWANDEKVTFPKNQWVVELSGLYDRAAVMATVEDLKKEHPGLMTDRRLYARESGVERGEGKNRMVWYRLWIIPAEKQEDAQLVRDALQKGKRRCRVVQP